MYVIALEKLILVDIVLFKKAIKVKPEFSKLNECLYIYII